jgi:hypothetical protein
LIEVIWASVDSDGVVDWKNHRLGRAGLLQVALLRQHAFAAAVTVFALFQVSVAGLILSLVYFILGYLLFAGLMAGTAFWDLSTRKRTALSFLDPAQHDSYVLARADQRRP